MYIIEQHKQVTQYHSMVWWKQFKEFILETDSHAEPHAYTKQNISNKKLYTPHEKIVKHNVCPICTTVGWSLLSQNNNLIF